MILFDVQGTLIDVSGIRHLVEGEVKRFDDFHEATMSCPPHRFVVRATHAARIQGHAVGVLTGMTERFRSPLGIWLADHGVEADLLLMRPDGLFCSDVELKAWRLRQVQVTHTVVQAWDDQPRLWELWESNGIETVRVPGWEGTK
jgi:hypothetical protein